VVVGLVALALALHGQHQINVPEASSNPKLFAQGTRWYEAAVLVLLLGWSGTYANQTLIRPWVAERAQAHARPRAWLLVRLTLAASAVVLNVLSLVILRGNWSSRPGGALWAGSLALLLLGCSWERSRVIAPATQQKWTSLLRGLLAHRAEVVAVAVVCTLAVVMRLWRLGDLEPGMHGDEGEAGLEALNILNGKWMSPFMPGWFNQSGFFYWSIAIGLKLFGTGLAGLRSFSTFSGLVTVLFLYLLARELFGARVAVLATGLLSVQSAHLIFSRQEFSNITTPMFLTIAFYFLVVGLRTRSHGHFVLSGLAAGFALYYFAGGRLVGVVCLALLAYLVVRDWRFLRGYWTRLVTFVLAFLMTAGPFVLYFIIDHPIPANAYPNDRFVWVNHQRLASQYGSNEWSVILWNQLRRTVSIITFRPDISAMGALDYPIAQTVEAGLIVLGLAWAAWRWRDTRFMLLSLWFWSSIVAGGVLTIDAPSLPRIVGILPALPLAIATVVDHFATQTARILKRWERPGVEFNPYGQWAAAALAILMFTYSAVTNWHAYIDRYLHTHQLPNHTMQALYVQQHGPSYRFYNMGAHVLYWNYGINRFINYHADGTEAVNLPNLLPIIDNGPHGNKDVAFLIWPVMRDYLPLLQAYYPEGATETIPTGDPGHPSGPMIAFTLKAAEINQHRIVHATYVSAVGKEVKRDEPGVLVSGAAADALPLAYPAQATWQGALVAPAYGLYRLSLEAPVASRLLIDGMETSISTQGNGQAAATSVVLARGPHAFQLTTSLPGPDARVDLQWAAGAAPLEHIAPKYWWDDHIGRSWHGDMVPLDETDPLRERNVSGSPGAVALAHRVDGYLGFRASGDVLTPHRPFSARWVSEFIAPEAGTYTFELNSSGSSLLLIDGRVAIRNISSGAGPQLQKGAVVVTAGRHTLDVRYAWKDGVGYLEGYWAPPGLPRQPMISPALAAPGPAVWRPEDMPLPRA